MDDLISILRDMAAGRRNKVGDFWSIHYCAEAADELEAARAEREVIVAEAMKYASKSGRLHAKVYLLAEALREAMEWNWIDGDVPDAIQVKVRDALRGYDQENEK